VTDHPQVEVRIDERIVEVDELLAPLISLLWRRGIATIYSCQEATLRPGRHWMDEPDEPRFQLVFPDVEEYRKLVPYLSDNVELVRSIYGFDGAPRWECSASVKPTSARLKTWSDPPVRVQLNAYIPLRQLPLLIAGLTMDAPVTLNFERWEL
jgi:hypothetical protein